MVKNPVSLVLMRFCNPLKLAKILAFLINYLQSAKADFVCVDAVSTAEFIYVDAVSTAEFMSILNT